MPVFENEKEFETVLMENIEILDEWFDSSVWENQIQLPGYGVADIIGISCEVIEENNNPKYLFKLTVIELKVGKITKDHIVQICRYRTAMSRMLEHLALNKNKYKIDTVFYLIGSEVGGDNVYLFDNIPWLEVMTYNICPLNGLSFDSSKGWYSGEENTRKQSKNLLKQAIDAKNSAYDFYLYGKTQAGE